MMPLGMEVGLGPGDFVFDVDAATLEKNGTSTPHNFGRYLLWPNSWMDEDHLLRKWTSAQATLY